VCIACTSPEIDDPSASDPDPVEQAALRNEKRWNFRTSLSDAYQAGIIARVLLGRGDHGDVNGDGKLKLGIYASDESYGHGFSNTLKTLVEKEHPGAIVEQVFHGMPRQPGNYDFAADVQKLLGGAGEGHVAPDAVVEISFAKYLASFMRAWEASGTKVPIFHTHGFRVESLIYQLGPALEGAEGTSQALLGDGPSAAAFSEDMIAATTRPPGFRDAAAYDAAMNLMLATLQAARAAHVQDPNALSGAQIRDAMWSINDPHGESVTAGVAGIAHGVKLLWSGKAIDYRGASGPCDFDEWGDVRTRLARFHVQGGKFVDEEKYDCSVSADCPPLLPHAER
jgi:branched-chain amino acid transport system substrate-binding protein